MKILLLSDPNSPHTIKWVRALANRGIEIFLFGLSKYDNSLYKDYDNVQVYTLSFEENVVRSGEGNFKKLSYIKALSELKKIINRFKPDILHAHYATSYGLLGALAGFKPYIISVWGSDIYDFPKKSFLHKQLIKFNLHKADKVLSTSYVMAEETKKYTNKNVEVTPFGIDLDIFKPKEPTNPIFEKDDIVIGIIKTLEKKYGIEYLIKAFKIVKDRNPDKPLKLLIVGGGSLENSLKTLVRDLNLENNTVFTGRINYDNVPDYHNMVSVFVSLSILDSESFGVAIIEASACQKPVVVSNVGGLPEVVENGKTGFVVQSKNIDEAALNIEKLVLDNRLRKSMGIKGRERVKNHYNWDHNVEKMVSIYNSILDI